MQAAIIDGRAAALHALQIQQKQQPAQTPNGVPLSRNFEHCRALTCISSHVLHSNMYIVPYSASAGTAARPAKRAAGDMVLLATHADAEQHA